MGIFTSNLKNSNLLFSKIKRRFDGSMWGEVKKSENALLLYEKIDAEYIKNQNFLREYLKFNINRFKFGFFFGVKIVDIFYLQRGFYDQLYSNYLSEQKDSFIFKNVRLPLPNKNEERIFTDRFRDIIFPYIIDNIEITKTIMENLESEGPYELDKNVCLKENDIVIDCGANMGFFSAVASAKGCIVYSFEPFPYIIEKYLSKTASWNKNINICKYALWNNETILEFEQNYESTGASSAVIITESDNKIKVPAIKLDDFAHRNNLLRVDFIKADIEGAERNMLLGAKEVIREFSPKISICTYHLPDDPKVLREILLDTQPKYKIHEQFKKMYAYVPKD